MPEKGELLILGRRYIAIDAEALCNHLDSCVGKQVAEVIMNNHETRQGKEDVAKMRRENPQYTVPQILSRLIEEDRISGMGITRINLTSPGSIPVVVETDNPAVNGIDGAAKALVFSYWVGALGALLERELEVTDVIYDQRANQLRGRLVPRLRE